MGTASHHDGGPYRMLMMSLDAQLQLAMTQMQGEESCPACALNSKA